MPRIPDRLRKLLESVELEGDVTVEGDDDGWTVTVELDHFEFLGEERAEGRRLHVIVTGAAATPNDAADEAARRLEQILESGVDDYRRVGP